jgi:nitrite reductase (NADH) small subunit
MAEVALGPLDEIPDGEGKAVVIDGRRYAVFREGERVFVVDDACPHRGGPLSDGLVGGGCVTCPLHGWKIAFATGDVVEGGRGRVRVLRGSVQAGEVIVETDEP